jgi:murein DD-endopeptidase MepM/ murein hydrolase activator NlpD
VWAGWRDNGGGYQVWVRHAAGVYTAYYHLDRVVVRPGQWTPRGKAVGIIGDTGFSRGTHLHFELWRNGVPGSGDSRVNPLRYAKP